MTPLRVILGEGSYAILGPGLSYSVYTMTNGAFTYYVPAHDPHESDAGTEDVGGAAHVTASIINGLRLRVGQRWDQSDPGNKTATSCTTTESGT